MKKKILFIMPSLDLGGAEKSLISLLNVFDYDSYDVDLLLFSKTGVLLPTLSKKVNVMSLSGDYLLFYKPILSSLFSLLIRGKISLFFARLHFFFNVRFIKNPFKLEQKSWKIISKSISVLPKKYDVAIGYLEKSTNYFVLDKVNATKKIGWIHSDLEKMNLDLAFEQKILAKLDAAVTVSLGLSERLAKRFPSLKNKIHTIENIINIDYILKKAAEPIGLSFDADYINLIYVGRLAKEKGLFNALNAIKILTDKGYKINWYLVGTGDIKEALILEAKKNDLENNLIFLDFQANPYPFIKQADIFILPSFYEGKSIALEEAKILNKLIVVTNFSSAINQIKDEETGLIAKMEAIDIAVKIEKIMNNKILQKKFKDNLLAELKDNTKEVEKLYKILN